MSMVLVAFEPAPKVDTELQTKDKRLEETIERMATGMPHTPFSNYTSFFGVIAFHPCPLQSKKGDFLVVCLLTLPQLNESTGQLSQWKPVDCRFGLPRHSPLEKSAVIYSLSLAGPNFTTPSVESYLVSTYGDLVAYFNSHFYICLDSFFSRLQPIRPSQYPLEW